MGDQATVTFNAHMYCFDPASTAMGVALELRSVLEATLGGLAVAQLGLAAGSMLAGSCGCAAFRVLVCRQQSRPAVPGNAPFQWPAKGGWFLVQ